MAKKDSQGTAAQASVLISGGKLKDLLASKRKTAKKMDELNAGYRAELAIAVEKSNLHKKAYATLVMLDKMEPEAALEYWIHLSAYMDLAGISEKIDSVAKLPLAEEEKGDVGGKPSKVSSLAKKRAERAKQESPETVPAE